MRILLLLLLTSSWAFSQSDTLKVGQLTIVGKLADGEINGFGYEYLKEKLIYEGHFKNSIRNGSGKAYYEHMVQEGTWDSKGKLTDALITYDGGFQLKVSMKNEIPHGTGEMKYLDGTIVSSNYKNGKPKGQSTILYPDGVEKIGIWTRTKRNALVLYLEPKVNKILALTSSGEPITMIRD